MKPAFVDVPDGFGKRLKRPSNWGVYMAFFLFYTSPDPYKKTGGEFSHRRSKKGGITRGQPQFTDNNWVDEAEIGRP
jgi:hypothetical protein